MVRKLPIGLQSFESLRQVSYLYVDKTAYVHRLAQEGKPYFLSQPQRFGKSLLVSMLHAYFEGRHDLFCGLDIERLEGDGLGAWQARPVFSLSDWEDARGARDATPVAGFGCQRARAESVAAPSAVSVGGCMSCAVRARVRGFSHAT